MKKLKPLGSRRAKVLPPTAATPVSAPAPKPREFVPVKPAELPPPVHQPKAVVASSPKPEPHKVRSGFAMPLPTVVETIEKRIGIAPLHRLIRADDANLRVDDKTLMRPGDEAWRRLVYRVELTYKHLSPEFVSKVFEDLECLQPLSKVKMIGYTHSGAWRHQLNGLKFSVRVLRVKGSGHIAIVFNNCWFGE